MTPLTERWETNSWRLRIAHRELHRGTAVQKRLACSIIADVRAAHSFHQRWKLAPKHRGLPKLSCSAVLVLMRRGTGGKRRENTQIRQRAPYYRPVRECTRGMLHWFSPMCAARLRHHAQTISSFSAAAAHVFVQVVKRRDAGPAGFVSRHAAEPLMTQKQRGSNQMAAPREQGIGTPHPLMPTASPAPPGPCRRRPRGTACKKNRAGWTKRG